MVRRGIFFLCFLCLLGATKALQAGSVISEVITFLDPDGRHFLYYKTARTDYPTYDLWFDKNKYPTLEDAMKDYLYFYPNEFQWDAHSNPTANLLRLNQGSYAMLRPGKFEVGKDLFVDEDGTFTYVSGDSSKRTQHGHFGFWNYPDPFAQFVFVWVIPHNFELVEYRSNRSGEWVRRRNVIAYYGNMVNDLIFTIKLRPKQQATYLALKRAFGNQAEFDIEQMAEGIRVTLGATVLFRAGSSELSEAGKAVLDRVLSAVKNRTDIRIVVNGHTDNTPIQGPLKKTFPTNWELSAARALGVVHYFARHGFPEKQLEARAFGANRPIASNETEEGRAKNRRIELLILEERSPSL